MPLDDRTAGDGRSAVSPGRLYHDLRSALGAVSLSLETLKEMESEGDPLSSRRAEIVGRALHGVLEAARIANQLETHGRGDGGDGIG
jgi:signal transduction histidine kinase